MNKNYIHCVNCGNFAHTTIPNNTKVIAYETINGKRITYLCEKCGVNEEVLKLYSKIDFIGKEIKKVSKKGESE